VKNCYGDFYLLTQAILRHCGIDPSG